MLYTVKIVYNETKHLDCKSVVNTGNSDTTSDLQSPSPDARESLTGPTISGNGDSYKHVVATSVAVFSSFLAIFVGVVGDSVLLESRTKKQICQPQRQTAAVTRRPC